MVQALGMEVKELRCVLVEDMRRYERRHVKDKGAMEEQVPFYFALESIMPEAILSHRGGLRIPC